MFLHEIHSNQPKRRRRKRVGRGPGSGHGKTCGRGTKGYKSRSGSSVPAYYEGGQMPLVRRVPKRGFSNVRFATAPRTTINVSALAVFPTGSVVTPDELRRRRIVRAIDRDGIKILGDGALTIALTVHAHAFSAGAKQKIEAAGGTVEILPRRSAPKVRAKAQNKE